ncbi:nitrilase-related carbon-nitrogen hydrolase [Saccharothrix longispora]|uniref:nitrilase-related carbon-nitrogen hydrolase n=1 Tax=Saccharothrix longispora TaxID=33920 RepID=UPI0028FD1A38|nr:nitrilase-related carbon-nitrogen hydrolase [Saccharothrix longispora]MDU0293194.1 nitrilase-related carbon-nitrogen hydrolase [Saccharothrix longispora]
MIRVAAARVRCPWLDVTAGVRVVVDFVGRAAARGVDLVAFPEAAVEVTGPEVRLITEAARDHGVLTYPGIAERDPVHRAVHCALLAIDPARGVVGVHRKLVPTAEERLVRADGDGHGLRVHDAGGLRVGGLCCWENWSPLARHSLYAQAPTRTSPSGRVPRG